MTLNEQSGLPYTETTGFDNNGDGIFNDRPVGVERNTLRGAMQWTLSGYFSYTIPFRRRAVPVTGVTATGFTGSTVSSVGTYSDRTRYRLTFSLHAQNITNHSNDTGYSGVPCDRNRCRGRRVRPRERESPCRLARRGAHSQSHVRRHATYRWDS